MQFTADYINRRIEHAGATLRCLRVKNPKPLLAQGRIEIVRDHTDWDVLDVTATRAYPVPSARDIALMDESLSWITQLVPNETHRRLLSLRSRFDPIKLKHSRSWRACGETLKISQHTAESWHHKGIALLQRALNGWPIQQPAGCNVLTEHIALHWLDG